MSLQLCCWVSHGDRDQSCPTTEAARGVPIRIPPKHGDDRAMSQVDKVFMHRITPDWVSMETGHHRQTLSCCRGTGDVLVQMVFPEMVTLGKKFLT